VDWAARTLKLLFTISNNQSSMKWLCSKVMKKTNEKEQNGKTNEIEQNGLKS
jgi:hypothetical protein